MPAQASIRSSRLYNIWRKCFNVLPALLFLALPAFAQHAPKKPPIRRSAAAKHQFEKQTGYPKGRPGYVVDHVIPLACGGADAPSNMQWQTKEEAKAKDKVERKGC